MIQFNCKCGGAMSVPDSMAGQVEKCPDCGRDVSAPSAPVKFRRSFGEQVSGVLALLFVVLALPVGVIVGDLFADGVGFVVGIGVCILFISAAAVQSAITHVLLYLRTIANNQA